MLIVKRLLLIFGFFLLCLRAEAASFLSINQVIKETVEYQWSIQTSELNIQTQEGLLLQAKGAFNPLINASVVRDLQKELQTSLGQPTNKFGRTTNSLLSVQTLTRPGTLYDVSFTNDNTYDPLLPPRNDQTALTFTVSQPLLRNLLYSPQTTLEKTQILEVEAARLQNIQNIANAVYNSLVAYWEFLASKKNLKILRMIEEELCRLESYAVEMVKEDQEGYSSLYQPRADLAASTAQRVQAEQDVRSTYNTLLFNMGHIPDGSEEIPEIEIEQFPPYQSFCAVNENWFESLLEKIPELRGDLVALKLQEEVARLNLKSAKNALLPELNILGGIEFQNTKAKRGSSDTYSSVAFRDPQRDFTIGFNFSFPIFNQQAKGLVKQQKAALSQSYVNYSFNQSQIITSFKTAFTFYNALLFEVKKQKLSADEYRKAVDAEILKLQEGLSTYFYVLYLEQFWQNTELQLIFLEKTLAETLDNLRLLTGTLVKWNSTDDNVEIENIMASPSIFPAPPCLIDQGWEDIQCESITEEEAYELNQ